MMPPINTDRRIAIKADEIHLEVCLKSQQLSLIKNAHTLASYPVSTAKNGAGEKMGSQCTPRGWHTIRAKIGTGQVLNRVFVGRRPTGEIYTPILAQQHPQRDWILTRILWLGGLEPGFNRYGQVDTTWRYIYIHGCPDERMDGQPDSHGCIRMHNADVADLFERVQVGSKVFIYEA
jgi:lipoprotein-anchoring transpeptidase ErfK/SrfK